MKNVGGLPNVGRQPEAKSLFITLWDLSLPTQTAQQAGKKVQSRSIEFPLIASGAQTWVRAEGAAEWTPGPIATADAQEVDEETQHVPPTLIDVAALLPAAKESRFEVAVEPQTLRGVQFGGYYATEEKYIPTRDALRLVKILQWGAARWVEMYEAFADCANMQIQAVDRPDFTQCDSLHSAFAGSGVVEGLEGWDVATIADMTAMFYGCSKFVGKSLAAWNVRRVESMAMMFMECESFDANLGRWDVANVQDFTSIFSGCSAFRGRGVERWGVQEGAAIEEAFDGCFALQSDLPTWAAGDVSEADESYDDDEQVKGDRSSRVRKFRPSGADDD